MEDETVWKIVCAGLVAGILIMALMRSPTTPNSVAAGPSAAATTSQVARPTGVLGQPAGFPFISTRRGGSPEGRGEGFFGPGRR